MEAMPLDYMIGHYHCKSGEKDENNFLRRAFCTGHWPLAVAG